MKDMKNRLLRRVEVIVWSVVVIMVALLYLRIFTPLGGTFPERTRGPAAGVHPEFYELGDIPDDERQIIEALPTERVYE